MNQSETFFFRSDDNFTGNSHENLKKSCQTYIEVIAPGHPGRNMPSAAASSKEAADLRSSSAASFSFLEYALGNVFYHADVAAGNGYSQDVFLADFPLQTWLVLQNVLERFTIRRDHGISSGRKWTVSSISKSD